MARKAEEDPPELKALVGRLEALKQRGSAIRKTGGDTFMADLRTIPINAEIQYARASRESRDYQKVGRLLRDVQKELDEAEKLLEEQEAKRLEDEKKREAEPEKEEKREKD